ncbi:MAG: TatD family hydrolase [Balneolaceae bacterium]
MELADTHCHLYLEDFRDDLSEVFSRSLEAGVSRIFLPAIDWASVEAMQKLSHPSVELYRMAGIHPCSVHETFSLDEQLLYDTVYRSDFVAVGETGLDYYWDKGKIEEQKKSLSAHCRVAKAVGKPVILHNRESTSDLLDLIEREQDGSLTGIWHCFNGSVEEGERAIDLGLHLGIGGVLTFRNAGVDQTVKELPLDRMVLESDAPYLAPAPNRGKRNEPAWVAITASKLATVLKLSEDEIAERTTKNTLSLFGLDT